MFLLEGPGSTPAKSGHADMDKIVEPRINLEFLPSKVHYVVYIGSL